MDGIHNALKASMSFMSSRNEEKGWWWQELAPRARACTLHVRGSTGCVPSHTEVSSGRGACHEITSRLIHLVRCWIPLLLICFSDLLILTRTAGSWQPCAWVLFFSSKSPNASCLLSLCLIPSTELSHISSISLISHRRLDMELRLGAQSG